MIDDRYISLEAEAEAKLYKFIAAGEGWAW